jgi:hypothetical protein
MTRAVLIALALVTLVAGPAFAGGKHGHRGHGHGRHGHGGHRLHSSLPTRVFPHHYHHHRFRGHTFHRHGGGFGVFVAPPIIGYGISTYAVPEYVPPPPAYSLPAYSPPVTYAPPPAQRVVEFPNGRYVLHGDGITTPYRWVWIPNPPPAPPADEPAAPSPAPAPAPTSMPEPPRSLEFYRWTDDDGVTHFSDSLDSVPEPYRATATRSNT